MCVNLGVCAIVTFTDDLPSKRNRIGSPAEIADWMPSQPTCILVVPAYPTHKLCLLRWLSQATQCHLQTEEHTLAQLKGPNDESKFNKDFFVDECIQQSRTKDSLPVSPMISFSCTAKCSTAESCL